MEQYLNYVLIALLALFLILLLLVYRKSLFLARRYQGFMQGRSGASLEDVLQAIVNEQQKIQAEVTENRKKLQDLALVLDTALRGIGVVRYNAFQNTGGDLSFSVAILDAHKSGVVVSTIYGREESRTYAKPVQSGQSVYQLSVEEQEAISRAVGTIKAIPR